MIEHAKQVNAANCHREQRYHRNDLPGHSLVSLFHSRAFGEMHPRPEQILRLQVSAKRMTAGHAHLGDTQYNFGLIYRRGMDDELQETLVSVAAAGPFAASVGETIVEPPANLAAREVTTDS